MNSRLLRGLYLFALGIAVGSALGMTLAYLSFARLSKDPLAWLLQVLRQLLGHEDRLRFDLLLQ